MPPGIRVRSAGPDDAKSVTDCQTTCWREAYAGLVGDDYLYSAEVERRRLARWRARLAGGRVVRLAEDGTGVVGVASAGPGRDEPPPTPMELMSLYLRAAYHGTGLADRLLTAAVGAGPASLWVFSANSRARRFYARHGFAPDGAEQVDEDTGLREIRMVRPQIEPRGTTHSQD